MAEREGGFIVIQRRIKSWPVYRAMNAEQRHVVTEMLLAARWQHEPGEFWFGALKFEVPRGSFFMAEETLAEEAGTTRKVVRTVFKKLLTEGFMSRRAVHSSGQCPHLVSIVNYDKYQSLPEEEGQSSGQRRAKEGPKTGQRRAPNEPREPVEPREPPSCAADAAPKDSRHQVFIDRAYATAKELGDPEPDIADGHSLRELKGFLARNKSVGVEEWDRRWRRLLAQPNTPHRIWVLIDRWPNLGTVNGVHPQRPTLAAITPATADQFKESGYVKVR